MYQLTANQIKSLGHGERHRYISYNFPADAASIAKRKSVYGVGINDAGYLVTIGVDGERLRCPAYVSWADMLCRCYSPNKFPTYEGVTVCDDWLLFSEFMFWWRDNQKDGMQLDKDLLSGSKIYSPETCLFVPPWLNSFLIDCRAARGDYLIGVNRHKLKYRSTIRNPFNGKKEHLGMFDEEILAHNAWKDRKLGLADLLKPSMDSVDTRIYDRVIQLIGDK